MLYIDSQMVSIMHRKVVRRGDATQTCRETAQGDLAEDPQGWPQARQGEDRGQHVQFRSFH